MDVKRKQCLCIDWCILGHFWVQIFLVPSLVQKKCESATVITFIRILKTLRFSKSKFVNGQHWDKFISLRLLFQLLSVARYIRYSNLSYLPCVWGNSAEYRILSHVTMILTSLINLDKIRKRKKRFSIDIIDNQLWFLNLKKLKTKIMIMLLCNSCEQLNMLYYRLL